MVAVHLVGESLTAHGTDLRLLGNYVLRGAPTSSCRRGSRCRCWSAPPAVLWGPALARRLSWRLLLPVSAVATAAWAIALALTSGWGRLTQPLSSVYEYPHDVARVGGIGQFLATFLASVPPHSAHPWTAHVGGHPVGALLTFVLLDHAGLAGLAWAAALCIAGGALAVPATLVGVRAVAGEATARRVAPFAVLAPTALWVATSADGFFSGVTAWGIALLALAAARDPGRGALVRAFAGGLLLGAGLFLSFGLAALLPLAVAVVAVQFRRFGWSGILRVYLAGGAAVLLVVAGFAVSGYWWFDGLAATDARLATGQALTNRPWGYFAFANVAALAFAVGPAAIGGLGALRRVRLAVFPLTALAGVLISDLTGVVRGETERLWMPFAIWIVPAAALLPVRYRRVLAGGIGGAGHRRRGGRPPRVVSRSRTPE